MPGEKGREARGMVGVTQELLGGHVSGSLDENAPTVQWPAKQLILCQWPYYATCAFHRHSSENFI